MPSHSASRASQAQKEGVGRVDYRWCRGLLRPLFRLLAAFLVILGAVGPAHAGQDFLDPEVAFAFSAAMATPERLDVHFRIAPEYYLYRDRFAFELEPAGEAQRLGEAVLPPALVQYDPTFDEDMPVYYGRMTLQLPIAAGAGRPLQLTVISQGCADAGLCYTPIGHTLTLVPTSGGYVAQGDGVVDAVPDIAASTPPGEKPGAPVVAGTAFGLDTDRGLATWLGQAAVWQVVGLGLLLGLLLSFTPCVLPMVPILLAILAGGGEARARLSRSRGLGLAAVFVLGMSLVYTAMGVAAGLLGASLAVWLQTPWVLVLFATLLALFALAMFDVFTFQMPTGAQGRLAAWQNRLPGGRLGGVFLMGMVSALIVGPCVAAPLAGVLLFISQSGDVVLGGMALFAMAWGQGVLLLAVGASSGVLLPRAGPWMEGIKQAFGVLLLATAWWMLGPVLPMTAVMTGWALLALWSAALLGAFHWGGTAAATVFGRLRQAVGLSLAIWAALLFIGLAAGGRDLLRPLAPFATAPSMPALFDGVAAGGVVAAAPVFTDISSVQELNTILADTQRPVLLDFYADWCVTCIQMERFTFTDPEVARLMADYTLLRADVTQNLPEHRELLRRFQLFGPPGIIFFDAGGRLREDVRIIGFMGARDFAQRLRG
ncbi:MAG: protein-disulfide reductase DsbD [Castellaniella sp.]